MKINYFDIYTIIQKELKELIELTTAKKTILRIVTFIAFIGIFFPFFWGKIWMNSYIIIYFWSWFGCFLIIVPAGNSIVKERNFGTLETLLSSQIPDYAISIGKLLSAFIYSFTIVLCGIIIGCLAVSLKEGTLIWYDSACLIYGIFCTISLMIIWSKFIFLLSLHTRDPFKVMQLTSLITLLLIGPGIYIRINYNSYSLQQLNEMINSFFLTNWLLIPFTIIILVTGCIISYYYVLIKVTRNNLMNEK